jgi:ParB family chromosome partitioning protein
MAKRKRLAPAQPISNTPKAAQADAPTSPRLSAHPAPPSAQPVTPPIAQVAGDASTAAALDELSETLRRARAEGRMIMDISLERIDETYLVRDRIAVDDEDMEALKTSLAARGQQTPIELVALEPGSPHGYGLISGWRRMQGLRALGQGTARAIITPPSAAPDAYVAMIEENEIRVGLSYFERARIVVKAVEIGAFESDKTALQTLFSSASRAKRSKIKSFVAVVLDLGSSLKYPAHLGERLGLQLSKALGEDKGAQRRLQDALKRSAITSAQQEQDVLRAALTSKSESKKENARKKNHTTGSLGVAAKLSASRDVITLTGQGVSEDFYRALQDWLKTQLR